MIVISFTSNCEDALIIIIIIIIISNGVHSASWVQLRSYLIEK
jgi:hypothetical protein